VYLRCPDCNGRRFRDEVLEIVVKGKSIADVLELTVSEALAFFRDHPRCSAPETARRRRARVPARRTAGATLSGGEAQRLKLAGHLVEASPKPKSARGSLFLFDEPTTGLHFDDVAKLLSAFRQLIAAGHSLVVIEHNLDVIRAADWLIDLGPEGGDAGARSSAPERRRRSRSMRARTPAKRCAITKRLCHGRRPSHGGARRAAAGPPPRVDPDSQRARAQPEIHRRRNSAQPIHGRHRRLGFGKIDARFRHPVRRSQRRYLESLNAYARQFVQSAARARRRRDLRNSPTVAIEQRTSRAEARAPLATLTEILSLPAIALRQARAPALPDCKVPIEPQSEAAIARRLLRDYRGQRVGLLAPLVLNRKGYYTDLAKWARGKGYAFCASTGSSCRPTGGRGCRAFRSTP